MNKKEALGLIFYAAEKWGAAAALPTERERLEIRVQVWMDSLADIPADLVRASLAAAVSEFPPNVMQLRRSAEELAGVRPNLPDWDQFWTWVRGEASRSSIYLLDLHPHLDCPWPDLDGLLTESTLADWARGELTAHDLEMIEQAHMRRRFDAAAERARRETMTPAPVVVRALADRATGELSR